MLEPVTRRVDGTNAGHHHRHQGGGQRRFARSTSEQKDGCSGEGDRDRVRTQRSARSALHSTEAKANPRSGGLASADVE